VSAYANDPRVAPRHDGSIELGDDDGRLGRVAPHQFTQWKAYWTDGEEELGVYQTQDEAIHSRIGDPQ
jgi:hypothetical protein